MEGSWRGLEGCTVFPGACSITIAVVPSGHPFLGHPPYGKRDPFKVSVVGYNPPIYYCHWPFDLIFYSFPHSHMYRSASLGDILINDRLI